MIMPSQPVIKQLREDLDEQLEVLSGLEKQRLDIERNLNRLDRAIDQIAAVTRYLNGKLAADFIAADESEREEAVAATTAGSH